MNIYLVRHGKTDWNMVHKCQGRTDIPLNDEGRNAVKEEKKKIDKIDFDVCISSPLKRAKETAEILVDKRNIEIIYDDLLKERYFGDYEGTIVSWDLIYKMWDYKLNSSENGMEPLKDILKRTKCFLEKLNKMPYKNVLIVSHGCTIKCIHYILQGYDDKTDFMDFMPENSTVYKYEI